MERHLFVDIDSPLMHMVIGQALQPDARRLSCMRPDCAADTCACGAGIQAGGSHVV